MDFAAKYDATPFDASDRFDRIAEQSRKVIVQAWLDAGDKLDTKDGEDLQAVAGGALVGLVCCMSAHMRDEDHDKLRAGLLQLIPWAVDLARDMGDLAPLPEA